MHPRRRSIYNFFLRHQDAVETPDEKSSPTMIKKELRPSGTSQSLHPTMPEEPNKPTRSSIIRRRRAGSMKTRPTSMSGINMSGCQRTQSEKCTSTDVSILVTEASPEGGNSCGRPLLHRQNSEATVVQVLVHRESEEYNNEEDENEQPNILLEENTEMSVEPQTVDRMPQAGASTTDVVLPPNNSHVTGDTSTTVVIDIDTNLTS